MWQQESREESSKLMRQTPRPLLALTIAPPLYYVLCEMGEDVRP
mgnify:FL=1